jgi:hypothetical protein
VEEDGYLEEREEEEEEKGKEFKNDFKEVL